MYFIVFTFRDMLLYQVFIVPRENLINDIICVFEQSVFTHEQHCINFYHSFKCFWTDTACKITIFSIFFMIMIIIIIYILQMKYKSRFYAMSLDFAKLAILDIHKTILSLAILLQSSVWIWANVERESVCEREKVCVCVCICVCVLCIHY